jgi:hypothetical protein
MAFSPPYHALSRQGHGRRHTLSAGWRRRRVHALLVGAAAVLYVVDASSQALTERSAKMWPTGTRRRM